MVGRMAGGVAEQRDAASLDRGRHAGTAVFVPPSPFLSAPPKLFLADDSGVSGRPPVVTAEAAVMSFSPTSTLQAAGVGSPTTTSPAATAVPFSRYGASSSSSGGERRCNDGKSRGCQRPAWEAARHHARLGLAGALNASDDAVPVPHAATVLRGQSLRSPASLAADRSTRSTFFPTMSQIMEASDEYTRVIARGGPNNPRTTHIFDDGCGVGAGGEDDDDGESSFLRWCHGCSKDLGQGKDIFMYRGEMAFCSHECRYREMLLFDEES